MNSSPKLVLGLSYGFHDSSAALAREGRLLAAHTEERLTHQKHDSSFPQFSIEQCLSQVGAKAQDLDSVVYYENPGMKFTRVLDALFGAYPTTRGEFVSAMKNWLGGKLWVRGEISKRLGIPPSRIRFIPHHLSHQAQAFVGSGFEQAAILTVDAVGEWDTASLGRARWVEGIPEITTLRTIEYPHSLGLLYSAFTAFMGFKPMSDECSTMALAAYGQPRYMNELKQLATWDENGNFVLSPGVLNFDEALKAPFTSRFLELFGEPRDPARADHILPFDSLSDLAKQPAESSTLPAQRFADIAASIQLLTEEVLLGMARELKRLTGEENLCFAGGVALNCVANSRLIKESGFQRVFIPLDPGDGGASVGAALWASATSAQAALHGISQGGQVSTENLEIEKATLDELIQMGAIEGTHWAVKQFAPDETSQAALLTKAARAIADGKIVGWFQGRQELGPRALGNRSILIRPDQPELARKLSGSVKKRAAYRPYALSMTLEAAREILTDPRPELRAQRWMQTAAGTRPEARERFRSGLHSDGTTRPQICLPEDNPLYEKLLQQVGRETGLGAVINTSFNERGYPMVASPIEAYAQFARGAMDVLVVENLWIEKQERT